MDQTVYVDLRCLQDYKYRNRGIGHHLAALLRTRSQSGFGKWKTVGLTDPEAEDLPSELAALVDEVSASLNPCIGSGRVVFVDGTPMTHDARFSLRFVGNPSVLNAAAVHDFIPLDWPGYLPTLAERIEYIARIGRLKRFDYYLPVSRYTARRLSEVVGVSKERLHVTGSSVRDSLYKLSARPEIHASAKKQKQRYVLLVGGPDRRKNLDVVVQALRYLNLLYAETISLKIVGDVWRIKKDSLFELAGHPEGKGFLEFVDEITDHELVKLLANAVATVVPSHIEGFSLPVVEAAVCGCPVIASGCAAHVELIDRSEALFPPSDAAALADKLEAVLNDEDLRASLIKSQAPLADTFHEGEVGRRFWGAIEAEVENRFRPTSTPAGKRKKPKIAFLSVWPPDRSNAAFYTAMAMQAGAGRFDSDLYTSELHTNDLHQSNGNGHFRDSGPISVAALLNGRYNAVVSVLDGSFGDAPALGFFERYGGPCLLHDLRLAHSYFQLLGQQKFVEFASEVVGRSVSLEEAQSWLTYSRQIAPLFLDHVIARASPLIVQTAAQQTLIKQRYGFYPSVARCCPTTFFEPHELTPVAKQIARERLGISHDAFAMSSFGNAARSRSTDACVIAVDLLRHWRVPAELYLVGISASAASEINQMAARYGVSENVHCIDTTADSAIARDFLIASDAGIELRSYAFGAASTALSNCISAGLTSVTTTDMAISCDAPSYISTVRDDFSPLYIAEQLSLIHDSGQDQSASEGARAAYIETHNFQFYAERLAGILGVA